MKSWCVWAIALFSASAAFAQSAPESYLKGRETHVVGKANMGAEKIDLLIHMKPITAEGRIPVVVYAGGCNGWDATGTAYMIEHMERIEKMGYHVVNLDSHGSRMITNSCAMSLKDPRYPLPTVLAHDVAVAYEWLAKHPKIDPDRIGIFGFSAGGGAVTAYSSSLWKDELAGRKGYAALFAIYPFCYKRYATEPTATWTKNIQINAGELDDEVEPQNCAVPKPAEGVNAVVHLFPGTHHGYMLPELRNPVTVTRGWSGKKVTLMYNGKSQSETWDRTKQWFDLHLKAN